MYRIAKKKGAYRHYLFDGGGGREVAKSCEPGQFVIVRTDSQGERIL